MRNNHFDVTVGTVNLACVWDGEHLTGYMLTVEDGKPILLDKCNIADLKKALTAMNLISR